MLSTLVKNFAFMNTLPIKGKKKKYMDSTLNFENFTKKIKRKTSLDVILNESERYSLAGSQY